ncbi:MAG: cytochrome c oxidase subunit I, partial [Pseudomonadales bacterium]|nr:cytochrome c oxidase subunit I [Pseudomonadales bacterium]
AMGDTAFMSDTAMTLNAQITVAALLVGLAQLFFIANVIWSLFKGKKVDGNPWRATSLEWQTPQTPPVHGNWGDDLPIVHRWAYDYSVPGVDSDFVPQNVPEGDENKKG